MDFEKKTQKKHKKNTSVKVVPRVPKDRNLIIRLGLPLQKMTLF